MADERLERGWQTVRQINAPAAQRQWDDLTAIYPDFARYIVQSAYADVLSRPALPLRDREIATLAALTTLGNAPGQLKAHIEGALNVGLTREEDPRHGSSIVLTVADDGPGIAPEHIPRLTERFYRVDVASSRARGGTGLGLAIVKHSLRRHRGRLGIESEVGQGTVARVSLPEYRPGAPDQA